MTGLDEITARCCACNELMSKSKHINWIMLDKRATWEYPTWDNLLLKPGIPHINRACAVVCDTCLRQKKDPVYAIEIKDGVVIYHEISQLEEAFPIDERMLKEYP